MTSELRPAVEVYQDAADAAGSPVNCDLPDCRFCQAAAAVIKADREAVRAEVVRDIAAWLREEAVIYRSAWAESIDPRASVVADEIEAKFGGDNGQRHED